MARSHIAQGHAEFHRMKVPKCRVFVFVFHDSRIYEVAHAKLPMALTKRSGEDHSAILQLSLQNVLVAWLEGLAVE